MPALTHRRPSLELLEDRCTPAVTGGGGITQMFHQGPITFTANRAITFPAQPIHIDTTIHIGQINIHFIENVQFPPSPVAPGTQLVFTGNETIHYPPDPITPGATITIGLGFSIQPVSSGVGGPAAT